MTIKDVIEYIHQERARRPNICRNWSDAQLAKAIKEAIDEDSFGWIEESDRITGVAWGRRNCETKVCHVTQVITTNKNGLAQLMLVFNRLYQGWTLRADRNKKHVQKLVTHSRPERIFQLAIATSKI